MTSKSPNSSLDTFLETTSSSHQEDSSNHRESMDPLLADRQLLQRNTTRSDLSLTSSCHPSWYEQFHIQEKLATLRQHYTTKTRREWIETFIPMYAWLRSYEWKTNLPYDIVAGLSVGMMSIPQSMSYAKLAGLPVQYGLCSAMVPVFAYSVFGTSRQLAVGPVALLSLILNTGLTPIVSSSGESVTEDDQGQYNILAIQTALLVGVFYLALGLFRLGFVTKFLSHSVISGFTSGAAFIIAASQLKYIIGYNIPSSYHLFALIKHLFAHISELNYKTFAMGMSCIVVLMTMKYVGKTYHRFGWMKTVGPLVVTVACIVITRLTNLSSLGMPTVGYIPRGYPSFTALDWFPLNAELVTTALAIVVIGFMESIAIAKQLAAKHEYELDSNSELIGLGMANFFGAMFQSYPVTGSFSRSAVNNESGAVSGISGIVTGTLVMITLNYFTWVFEFMVRCVHQSFFLIGRFDHYCGYIFASNPRISLVAFHEIAVSYTRRYRNIWCSRAR